MKYLDEYRDPETAASLVTSIRNSASRRWTLMEVCGGQTHSLLRYGIEAELNEVIELIHGPGCPVCVTPSYALDFAQALAFRPATTLASFGDMLRVPGSQGSLLDAQGRGARIKIVYSPLDAVELAREQPDREIVFLAVGFETTVPATAVALLQAERLGLTNFSVLTSHVRVLPAMEAILRNDRHRIHGFLAAGHVCTVTGFEDYQSLVSQWNVPVVIAGFEPLDLLHAILLCVRQLEAGHARIDNAYARSVRQQGNLVARQVMEEVFEVADQEWRGLGTMRKGGLRLRARFHPFDAWRRYQPDLPARSEWEGECRSADVLTGRIKPPECPAYGVRCRPDLPLGAPMVSAEGACAAYYRYTASVPASSRPAEH